MATFRRIIVAWFDRDEWENVFQELYSSDRYKQKHALDRLAAWKCRMNHKLSTAIECTWHLVSAQLSDWSSQQSGHALEQAPVIRMTYSMALVRFVNLLTEKLQNRPLTQPTHALAEELGLPEWLVMLRHDATHAGLPTLPVMRDATQLALAYLKQSYWDAQRENCEESPPEKTPPPPVSEYKISKLIRQIYAAQIQSIQGEEVDVKETRNLLIELERAIFSNKDVALDVLLEPGHMIPTDHQLDTLNIQQAELCGCALVVPGALVRAWRPLLNLVHHLMLTGRLLQAAAARSTEEGGRADWMCAAWINTIIQAVTADSGKPVKNVELRELQAIYRTGKCALQEDKLLRACLRYPNKYTAHLLPALLSIQNPALSEDQCSKLTDLCEIHTRRESQPSKHNVTHSLQDILTESSNGTQEISDNRTEEDSISSYTIDETDWSQYPLGVLPGQTISYTNLELPACVDRLTARLGQEPHMEDMDCTRSEGREEASPQQEGVADITKWSSQQMQDIKSKICVF